ncbi:MAG: hypothetical protein WKF74_02785 [Pyrinomonadaceae bacterium]
MAERTLAKKPRKKRNLKPREISDVHVQTRLLEADQVFYSKLCRKENKTSARMLRDLVHEALQVRRSKELGRDETMWAVVAKQIEVVTQGTRPFAEQIKEMRERLDRHIQLSSEYSVLINEQLSDIIEANKHTSKGLNLSVRNIAIIRALLRYYVFEYHLMNVQSKNKTITPEQVKDRYRKLVERLRTVHNNTIFREESFESTIAVTADYLRELLNPN